MDPRSRALLRPRLAGGQLQSRRNFITIIEQAHEGWRLTFGRNPVPLKPGLNIAIPVVHTVLNVDMRETSIAIPNLPGYTSDNVPVTCSGSLFYRVTDSYKSCFAVSNVAENVKNTGTSAVRSVLGSFTYDQVIADRNELNKRLNQVIGNSIQGWGVECTRFEIQNFQPANREVERQLELQMEAERNRRKQMLDTQAQINVAEGMKQRVILESEGHLQAKSNEADAAFKTVVREAEARKQQSLMEASALAQQVTEIARSLSNSEEPSPEDKQRALAALIEIKRLEQLKAIAASQSNSTYFFGDKASMGVGSGVEAFNVDYAQHVKKGIEGNLDAKGKKIDPSPVAL
ncbi:stomatin family protein [Coprinopsis cinerea okayama7|uniref:Stomatin family protein n=1 Tax=Coprinopsis cinerea (strain Okayama-7 / 130 / ATCC MYA-4618 / FGSC 9003) TaxID=240176 RepID=A8NLU4_COPC7|nr:stomatin family protein [Coprinopsis cinerea okayama7\|eukprot:XP_001834777.1 stomatin family protein [Coprinopsis cinerea okayama7\